MSHHYGVYQNATGYLLRAGFSDFSLDPLYDPNVETQRNDAPLPAKTLYGPSTDLHKWTGSSWDVVTKPVENDDVIDDIIGTTDLDCSGARSIKIHVKLIGDVTIDFSNMLRVEQVALLMEQDAVGARVVTWDDNVMMPSAGVTLTAGATKKDLLFFRRFGDNLYLTSIQNDLK